VSFGGRLEAFFFAILHIRCRRASPFRPIETPGTRFGNKARIVGKAGTMGYAPACRHACDWQQKCRLR